MAVTICPWCQNEIPHEDGAEPDKWCPVCENELGGYRTITIGGEDEEEDEASADFPGDLNAEADLEWVENLALTDKSGALLQWEEAVEKLLDDQDEVPECHHCREYMVEAGQLRVTAEQFHPRVPASLGQAALEAPFDLTLYVCPSCFAVRQSLGEQSRLGMMRKLVGDARKQG